MHAALYYTVMLLTVALFVLAVVCCDHEYFLVNVRLASCPAGQDDGTDQLTCDNPGATQAAQKAHCDAEKARQETENARISIQNSNAVAARDRAALDGATFPGGVFPDKSDAKRDAMNEKITYLESTVKKLRNDLDRLRPYRVRDRDQM